MAILVRVELFTTDLIAIKWDYWSGVWSLIARDVCVCGGGGRCWMLPFIDDINRRRYDRSRPIESLQRGFLHSISFIDLVHKDLNGSVCWQAYGERDGCWPALGTISWRLASCKLWKYRGSPHWIARCSTALGTHRKCHWPICS
jgi:hypothetical protein